MAPDGDAASLMSWLGALGDFARLRMLRLLKQEELSVGELAKSLQMPQSTASRHLKLLHEGDWLHKRAAGTASLYRLSEDQLAPGAHSLWKASLESLESTSVPREDDARLQAVLAERGMDSRQFFGRLGGEWDHLRQNLFGDQFTTEALLEFLPTNWVVADLGCGTGNAAALLAPRVKRLIAVDREPSMLAATRKRLRNYKNVDFREGDLCSLPLKDREVDAAVVFLVMHHVEEPAKAVQEIARCLRPGGILLIVDMVGHRRQEYRQTMGHRHLGFDESAAKKWAKSGNLSLTRYHRLPPDPSGKGPSLFAATLTKP